MTTGNKAIPFVQQGDQITAAGENDIIRELNRLGNMGSAGVLSNGAGQFVKKRIEPFVFWRGQLSANLAAATNVLTGPGQSTCDGIVVTSGGHEDFELVSPSTNIPVRNYDKYAVYFDNEYVSGIIEDGVYIVLWPGRQVRYGVADAAINAEATGTVSLYKGATDSTMNVTAYNITDQRADSGVRVEITADEAADRWTLKPLECPAS